MGKLAKFLWLPALLAVLCGCGQEPAVEPEQPPIETVRYEPSPAPLPELFPELTPSPELRSGDIITVNGRELESGSVWMEDVLCARLSEIAEALETTWGWNSGKAEGGILWNGQWIELRGDLAGFRCGRHWITMPSAPVVLEEVVYVPVVEFCGGLGIGFYEDAEMQHLYFTPAAGSWAIPEGYKVPIIMYHGVTNDVWGATDLFVRPEDLDAQLQYLAENGYTPIWFEDLAHVDRIEKPVLLTFDDGYADNYHELFPLLQKYGMKATIFVITGTIDYNPRNLTSEQIRELSASGLVSIQSHTVTHPYLGQQTPEEQEWELTQSKLALLRLTGKEPYVICYPSGNYNEDTLELAKTHYRMGIDMNGGTYWTGDDPYEVSRWYFARSHYLETFIYMVS